MIQPGIIEQVCDNNKVHEHQPREHVDSLTLQVPFYRVELNDEEINEVVAALKSGWLTSGPRVRQFEQDFAAAVGAKHAVAVTSCTAALHLALEAVGLRAGQAVLVPTMTFAATAEVVRYFGAVPVLVDCDPVTLNMDLPSAAIRIEEVRTGKLPSLKPDTEIVGIIPVHVGGQMMDVGAVQQFAHQHGLWVVEDAAHAFPAAWRPREAAPWQRCGEGTAEVTCFSFYANKTITTGEGGMAVTEDAGLAEQMKLMSLHGLSRDAWQRYNGNGAWDYQIVAPGYKYNMTDMAAAIGIHQLRRAEAMRQEREAIVEEYVHALSDVEELELPALLPDRILSHHLFPVRLNLQELAVDRNAFFEELRLLGVGCSVHWRPLHLHPYYRDTLGWKAEDCPIASREWMRLLSLPLFPGMRPDERTHVVGSVRQLCRQFRAAGGPRSRKAR